LLGLLECRDDVRKKITETHFTYRMLVPGPADIEHRGHPQVLH